MANLMHKYLVTLFRADKNRIKIPKKSIDRAVRDNVIVPMETSGYYAFYLNTDFTFLYNELHERIDSVSYANSCGTGYYGMPEFDLLVTTLISCGYVEPRDIVIPESGFPVPCVMTDGRHVMIRGITDETGKLVVDLGGWSFSLCDIDGTNIAGISYPGIMKVVKQ